MSTTTPTSPPPYRRITAAQVHARLAAFDAATAAETSALTAAKAARAARDAVVRAMYYDDQLTLREIEALTGVPLGTAKDIIRMDPRHATTTTERRRRRRSRLPDPTELPPPRLVR